MRTRADLNLEIINGLTCDMQEFFINYDFTEITLKIAYSMIKNFHRVGGFPVVTGRS